ncbi:MULTISPECIES: hypothetical protein [unclassified Fusibacter]|uniref:hypothetical protein n=1 Tax=unclassified Fusibacter TaxID=2624464 RepID=UPI00101041DF|nr:MULTISPECIES: hypothetical protein [unclassified Fusibacter]MCK8059658.1 hypothetical protein [Fusibacter sp. A2]NPE21459.1 hypothetical protein [Fusibacter sp. A1]RXV61870.1 hypothetical protein DWB64_06430 [Fusibacter sp. A1]
MVNRIEMDQTGYHLQTKKVVKVKKNDSVLKNQNEQQVVKKTTSLKTDIKKLKVAQKSDYKRMNSINAKAAKQVIETYASYRKKIYEERIKTRFDLLL